jgi:hypothetical protein
MAYLKEHCDGLSNNIALPILSHMSLASCLLSGTKRGNIRMLKDS